MKQLLRNRLVLIIGLVFIAVIIGTAVATRGLGTALGTRFNSVLPTPGDQSINTSEKRIIKKIRVNSEENADCIEVTPDGVIRVYKNCGDEATDAERSQDIKLIQDLFKQVSEISFAPFRQRQGKSIKLTVETDQGTEIIYLPVESAGASEGVSAQTQQIISDIGKIVQEVNQPTPTPTAVATPSPTLPPGVTATPSPTTSVNTPTGTGLPTPTESGPPKDPFTCVFDDGSGKKPYRVSNVVCSSEPQPAN